MASCHMLQVTVVLYYHQRCLIDNLQENKNDYTITVSVHIVCDSKVVFAVVIETEV